MDKERSIHSITFMHNSDLQVVINIVSFSL